MQGVEAHAGTGGAGSLCGTWAQSRPRSRQGCTGMNPLSWASRDRPASSQSPSFDLSNAEHHFLRLIIVVAGVGGSLWAGVSADRSSGSWFPDVFRDLCV